MVLQRGRNLTGTLPPPEHPDPERARCTIDNHVISYLQMVLSNGASRRQREALEKLRLPFP